MKIMFLPFVLTAALGTCGNRSVTNSGPNAQFTAPVTEMAATLEAEEAAEEPQAVISWDKTVHDFGDISVADGPLSCAFTLTNTGQDPVAIFEVVSSCGCTDVQWTREPILPGKSGKISATYKNEDGPMPFDKTLTVYISGVKRPVVLRLRGVVHEKKKSLSQLYGAQKMGSLGLKSRALKTGTLKQGLSVSESVTVANLGKSALKVTWTNSSPNLSMKVEPNPIPAGSTATLTYTVSSNPDLYGKNIYRATPVLNGKEEESPLEITAWTQENFTDLSPAERDKAALPFFENSTFNFGIRDKGEKVEIMFLCTNKGQAPFHVFKADSESAALTLAEMPRPVPGQQKGSVRFTLDTSSLDKGENVIMVSLTTNSPLRPLINLFVAGEIR